MNRLTIANMAGGFYSGDLLKDLLDGWKSDYLLLILPGGEIDFGAHALERFVQVADDTGAGLIYSDFRETGGYRTPFMIHVRQNGEDFADVVFEEMEFNAGLMKEALAQP